MSNVISVSGASIKPKLNPSYFDLCASPSSVDVFISFSIEILEIGVYAFMFFGYPWTSFPDSSYTFPSSLYSYLSASDLCSKLSTAVE